MNIYSALNTAKWALLANQTAIEVTGQNIANVNNPNYNRQEVIFEAQSPATIGNLTIGRGVRIRTIQRRFDQYIFNQTLEANFNLEKWTAREAVMNRLDIILNEAGDNGINARISEMFQGFYNLSINPEGITERQDIIEKARSLAQKISAVSADLKRVRHDINEKIKAAIPEVNRLTSEIVRLNKLIHETETDTAKANDYRDMREGALNELSRLVDVSYFEQPNNEIVVMMNNGRPLVVGQSAFTLTVRTSPNDPEVGEILWEDAGGNQVNVLSEFNSGQLGAWVQLRDTDIINTLNDLDRLAATIIRDLNRLHVSGYGLDGSTGNFFFEGLQAGGRASISNTGGATLGTAIVTNPEIVDLSQYRLTFDGDGNYTVYNLDTGVASGSYTFTSGSPLTFFQQRGISLSITGTPDAGDTFYISGSHDAALNMRLNQTVADIPAKVASGATTNPGDGVQARRIADLQYQRTIGGAWSAVTASNGIYAASGLFTFDDFLGSMVGSVGSNTAQARSNRQLSESVSNQVLNMRESVSGVSLDEEMVNLIKYQHAYGAAAKMISIVDELLQTLLGIV